MFGASAINHGNFLNSFCGTGYINVTRKIRSKHSKYSRGVERHSVRRAIAVVVATEILL